MKDETFKVYDPITHAKASFGKCAFCGEEQDLRFGVCFDCADFVKVDKKGNLYTVD